MKKQKFWSKFTEEMMMNSRTAKDFKYWGKLRNLELKCELENWNLFDCLADGTTITTKQCY